MERQTTMAPTYKEDSYLIFQPGSVNTLAKFGLEDPLGLPSHTFDTKVYKKKNEMLDADGDQETLYTTENKQGDANEYEEILPIVQGQIVDITALQVFLKSVLHAVLKVEKDETVEKENEENDNSEKEAKEELVMPLENVNLLIVQNSSRWNPFHVESLVKYGFEKLGVHSVSVVPIELCVMFAYGSLANALVIDIGYEKTEILPIVDYQLFSPSKKVVFKGGDHINKSLSKLLPSLSNDQIEELKRSSIFECLSEEDAKKSFFGMEGLIENIEDDEKEDDGVLDIAAIVTSDKSTREILEDTDTKNKKKVETRPNSELETNQFQDTHGNIITVGKERFQGCNELIDSLVFHIYHCLRKIPDLKKRQDCYDNIIFAGKTSKIKGLKEKVMFHLFERYVVLSDNKLLQPQAQFRNDIRPVDDTSLGQVPRHLKIVPKVEYFSEWKKTGFEDCSFLGAQILSKQVFTATNELCMTKDIYEESGPLAIWNICL